MGGRGAGLDGEVADFCAELRGQRLRPGAHHEFIGGREHR